MGGWGSFDEMVVPLLSTVNCYNKECKQKDDTLTDVNTFIQFSQATFEIFDSMN